MTVTLVSRACHAALLESAVDCIVSTDGDGVVLEWNPAAERTFGYAREDAIGRELAELIVPSESREAHRAGLRRHAAGDGAQVIGPRLELTALRADGSEIRVEASITRADVEGRLIFTGVMRDLTRSERVQAREELRASQREVLQRLAVAAEYCDDETGEHTRRVGDLSARLATSLGVPEDEVELIRLAAPLHDIGKIGISDTILLKRGRLAPSEFEQVKTHSLIGADILAGGGFALLETAERIARSHHERWDGAGYPYGLIGRDIPLVGRIVAVADVFDALTHERPYKAAWSREDALAEIEAQRGRQFDPEVVDAFLTLFAVRTRERSARFARRVRATIAA